MLVLDDFLITRHTYGRSARLAEFAEAGGLISYGPNYPDLSRLAATYVDKILKGAKPSELPVEQPIKFDLVVNLKTAKALGPAPAISRRLLDSRQPSQPRCPMRRTGIAVVLTLLDAVEAGTPAIYKSV